MSKQFSLVWKSGISTLNGWILWSSLPLSAPLHLGAKWTLKWPKGSQLQAREEKVVITLQTNKRGNKKCFSFLFLQIPSNLSSSQSKSLLRLCLVYCVARRLESPQSKDSNLPLSPLGLYRLKANAQPIPRETWAPAHAQVCRTWCSILFGQNPVSCSRKI